MQLSELFSASDVVVNFAPTDKWEAIRKLVGHLVAEGKLAADTEVDVLEAVLSRERSMSTGMEQGIAIPHAAVEGLESVVACIGVVSEPGLSFESIDGRPTRVIVLLIIPKAQKLLHIRTLADVARALGRDEIRNELLKAASPEDALAALTAGEKAL
ncbi:MAG: mannitol/fructose-specific phosphotransferase system IIA component (Ntr-type) [Planctomycetota bacterium]|jgi:mannitol/fructose-specific phosphotransferase system IIA component (Ntr-type)